MNERKGILFITATAVISGVSIDVNSLGVQFVNPYVFTGMKNLLVGLGLFSLILVFREWKALKKITSAQWWQLTVIGLIGGAVPFLLFFKGLSMTMGAKGGFIHKTLFLYVALLAVFFLKEKMNRSMLLGMGALLVGTILFLGITPQAVNWGDGLVLLATLLWSVEIVISKKALEKLSARVVAWGRMFFGSLFILTFLVSTNQLSAVFAYNPEQWKWIAITSVFLLGYVYTFYRGLQHVRASVATAVLALGAPITGLIALIAQEGVMWAPQKVWGTALITLGIVLVIGMKQVRRLLPERVYVRRDR